VIEIFTKIQKFDVFSTVHHSIELFHQPTLMHNFLHSLTICLLHYYPRHVSSINMPIFRRKNHTASGIFALCKRLHSTLVESGLSILHVTMQTAIWRAQNTKQPGCCEMNGNIQRIHKQLFLYLFFAQKMHKTNPRFGGGVRL